MKYLFRIRHKNYNLWALLFQVMFFLFALILIGQLIRLQIIESGSLKEKAKLMRQPSRNFSFRGDITDRNGIRLASSSTLYDIYAHPQYYSIDVEKIAALLSPHLNQPANILAKKLNQNDKSTITIAKNINRDIIAKIKKLKIRGIDLVRKTERVYPQGNLASHILGYINFDADVAAGVERTGSQNLESVPQANPIEYTGKGDVIYDFNTDPVLASAPPTGEKLVLTIDSNIQHISEIELAKMVEKTKADRGCVIVMNPKTGELLSFAVLPSYNPNSYNKVNPSIVKNWALSDVYPPGSTFKIITVASALETGSVTKNERIFDSGKIDVQGWTIYNYDYNKNKTPGTINLKYLFEHSSNVGSLKVALKMPPYKFYDMLKSFGIGSKTGIDLPGESAGIIPDLPKWDRVTQATIGFGYSIAATPIQIASAVAAIANDGVWITPHVIKYNENDKARKIRTKRVLSSETAHTITNILADSITASKSDAGKLKHYYVAGKTGTSRKPNPNGAGYLPNQVYTSFAGYFPARDPQVLMMVVVDNPKGGDVWGSTVAGPVFNSIASEVGRILDIKPDK